MPKKKQHVHKWEMWAQLELGDVFFVIARCCKSDGNQQCKATLCREEIEGILNRNERHKHRRREGE